MSARENLQSRTRMRRLAVPALLLACAPAVAQAPAAAPAVQVVTAEVVRTQLQAKLWFSGSVISSNEAVLSSESNGRIVGIVEVGDYRRRGETIAQLDDVLLRQTLLEHQAEINSREAQIKFLRNEVRRLSQLAKNNNAAISLLEERQADLDVARSEFAAVSARAARTAEEIRRMQVAAPFDGVVSVRYTETGEWTSAGDHIAKLVDLDNIEVQTQVSARTLPHISPGDELEVHIGARRENARLRTIIPVGDERSRLFEIRLELPARAARPGQRARVATPIESARDSLLIPEDALVIRGRKISVFRIDDEMKARRVPVEAGISSGGMVEVVGALHEHDRVVVRGGEQLRDGATVVVLQPEPP